MRAYGLGYREMAGIAASYSPYHAEVRFLDAPLTNKRPRMAGYQVAGAAPFLRGGPVREPETVATAIRIGDPQSWDFAWAAQKDYGGWFDECTDAEILATQKLLAATEGVFYEPGRSKERRGGKECVRTCGSRGSPEP